MDHNDLPSNEVESDPVVTINLMPLQVGELLAVTPARVQFATSVALQDAPASFDPDDPCWELRKSHGDSPATNELFNRLQEAHVAGTTLVDFVRYDDVSVWQFLPSYIWPVFFRTVELVHLLNQIVSESTPRTIRVFTADDGTDHRKFLRFQRLDELLLPVVDEYRFWINGHDIQPRPRRANMVKC